MIRCWFAWFALIDPVVNTTLAFSLHRKQHRKRHSCIRQRAQYWTAVFAVTDSRWNLIALVWRTPTAVHMVVNVWRIFNEFTSSQICYQKNEEVHEFRREVEVCSNPHQRKESIPQVSRKYFTFRMIGVGFIRILSHKSYKISHKSPNLRPHLCLQKRMSMNSIVKKNF